jgi:hypothetical protein
LNYLQDNYPEHNHTCSPQTKAILNAGVNKISVKITNLPSGAWFRTWLLKASCNDSKVNNELTTTDALTEESLQLTTTNCYLAQPPYISSDFGLGKITFWTLDLGAVGAPQGGTYGEEEILRQFMSNILAFEFMHRKQEYKSMEQLLQAAIEHNLLYHHNDVRYDRLNEDDHFGDISDYDILLNLETVLSNTTRNLLQFLSATRENNEQPANADRILETFEELFTQAYLTGNASGFYPYETLINSGGYISPSFETFDAKKCIANYANFKELSTEFFYKIMDGWLEEIEGAFYPKLGIKDLYYTTEWIWDSGDSYWREDDNIAHHNHGLFTVYNNTHVWVDIAINSDSATYLASSETAEKYYTIYEVLNATILAIRDLTTLRSDLSGSNSLLEGFSELMDLENPIELLGLDISGGMKNYVDGIRTKIFWMGYEPTYNYLAQREEEFLAEHPEYLSDSYDMDEENYLRGYNDYNLVYYYPKLAILNNYTKVPYVPLNIPPERRDDNYNQRGSHTRQNEEGEVSSVDARISDFIRKYLPDIATTPKVELHVQKKIHHSILPIECTITQRHLIIITC